jgi:hypothetical protein
MNDKRDFINIITINPCPFRQWTDNGGYSASTVQLYCEMKRFFTDDAFVVFEKDCDFCPMKRLMQKK